MEFIATNFNLPTIIVAALVFGALGWVVWHTHKHGGGCSCCGDCGCNGKIAATAAAELISKNRKERGLELSARALF